MGWLRWPRLTLKQHVVEDALIREQQAIEAELRWAMIQRDLDAALERRKAERIERAAAARKGVSTRWQRAGAQGRAMFGERS